jgi:uncharacterized protein DUF7033
VGQTQKVLRIRHPASWGAERRYAIGTLVGEFLGLAHSIEIGSTNGTELMLEADSSGRRLLVTDDLFARPEVERLSEASLPSTSPPTWNLGRAGVEVAVTSPVLPVVYGRALENGSYVQEVATGTQLNVDVFGAAFFFLSRYEELVRAERDDHGRFPPSASIASQAGLLERPIVNEYAELLWWALSRLWPRLDRPRREFRILLSHDVDWPFSRGIGVSTFVRSVAADLLVRHEPGLALRRTRSYAVRGVRGQNADIHNTFDALMDVSEAAGLRGAFNFIAGHSDERLDGAYSIEEPWITDLLRRIHGRGHEIGLHPSYNSFRDPERIRAEAERLRRVCEEEGIEQAEYGGRQHFLRWENPTTWQSWEDAGLSYDSTLGYPDRVGFRCGTCFEYPVFNVRTRRPLRLRERPLIVMEQAALDLHTPFDALAEIDELKRRCRLFGGDFTLLWHNSRLLSRTERAAYVAALS